jgi:hypothetical protein
MYIGLKAKNENTPNKETMYQGALQPPTREGVRVGIVAGLMSHGGVLHESLVTTEAVPYHIVI